MRLPAAVVEALDLKDGDNIEIRIAGARAFEVKKDRSREQAFGWSAQAAPQLPRGLGLRPRRGA